MSAFTGFPKSRKVFTRDWPDRKLPDAAVVNNRQVVPFGGNVFEIRL